MFNDIRKDLLIIELSDDIKTNSFCCEKDDLNTFFHERSKYNNKQLLSKIYIYFNTKTNVVIGFISLSCYLLKLANIKDFGIQKVPAALLGRLAIDNKYRHYDLGKDLISYIYGVCQDIKNYIGCRLLVTEVEKKDPILEYLKDYGFEIVHEGKRFYYLGIDLLISKIHNNLK